MASKVPGLLRWLAIAGAMTAANSPLVQAPDPENEGASANARPQYTKQEIWNGGVESFQYFAPSPSPHWQALLHALQWAENEVSLVHNLQQLKLEYVNNERRLEAAHTAQQLDLGAYYASRGRLCASATPTAEASLKGALAGTIAWEATPEGALQLFKLLEQAQENVNAAQQGKPAVLPVPPRAEPLPGSKPESSVFPSRRYAPKIWAPWSVQTSPVVDSRAGMFGSRAVLLSQGHVQDDSDRQELERQRQVLNRESDVYQDEAAAYRTQIRDHGRLDPDARDRFQAAQKRWSQALANWSDSCKRWSDVRAQRATRARASRSEAGAMIPA